MNHNEWFRSFCKSESKFIYSKSEWRRCVASAFGTKSKEEMMKWTKNKNEHLCLLLTYGRFTIRLCRRCGAPSIGTGYSVASHHNQQFDVLFFSLVSFHFKDFMCGEIVRDRAHRTANETKEMGKMASKYRISACIQNEIKVTNAYYGHGIAKMMKTTAVVVATVAVPSAIGHYVGGRCAATNANYNIQPCCLDA